MRWRTVDSMPRLELAADAVATAAPAFWAEDHPWMVHGLSVLLTVLFLMLYDRLSDSSLLVDIEPFSLLLALGLLIPIHECIHGLAHPRAGFSSATVIGFDRRLACPYCLYTRPCSRERAIVIALLPFVVITLLPLLVCVTWECRPLLAYVASFNAGASAFDIAAALYAWQRLQPGQLIGLDAGRIASVANELTSEKSL